MLIQVSCMIWYTALHMYPYALIHVTLIERNPPPLVQRTWYKFFEEGPLTHGSWWGNIVNRKPPRGGGVLSINVIAYISVCLDTRDMHQHVYPWQTFLHQHKSHYVCWYTSVVSFDTRHHICIRLPWYTWHASTCISVATVLVSA